MRCEVKTLPPHTAAVREGESNDFGGIRTIEARDELISNGIKKV